MGQLPRTAAERGGDCPERAPLADDDGLLRKHVADGRYGMPVPLTKANRLPLPSLVATVKSDAIKA